MRRSLRALSPKPSPHFPSGHPSFNSGSGTTPVPFNTPTVTPSDSYGYRIPEAQGCPDSPLYFKSPTSYMSHNPRSGSLSASTSASICNTSEVSEDLDDELEDLITHEATSNESIPSSTSERAHQAQKPISSSKGVGLGITGMSKQDGSPFDGLGLVNLRRWSRASRLSRMKMDLFDDPIPSRRFLLEDAHITGFEDGLPLLPSSDLELSETFLHEALMSFTHDPLHEHSLSTIPECRSWYELDLEGDDLSQLTSAETESLASNVAATPTSPASLARTKRHFSSSTISSELKRMPTSFGNVGFGATSRMRSATWPSHNGDQSPGLLSRPGRAWRV